MQNKLIYTACLLLLSACGTTSRFTEGMKEPVKATSQTASTADDAEQDVLKAFSIGKLASSPAPDSLPTSRVCRPISGSTAVSRYLGVFSDALDTVQKVGAKPEDTSYAGYVKQFKKNASNMESWNSKTAREEQEKKDEDQATRCEALFEADRAPGVVLKAIGAPGKNFIAITGSILAIDKALKLALSSFEATQRELAVHKTIENLLPQMKDAREQLKTPPDVSFGPFVQYLDGAGPAADMNKTVVGATINIRRWFVTQTLLAQWDYLSTCRKAKTSCAGDPNVIAAMQSFSANIQTYRSLAKLDPNKTLATLDTAITSTENSLKVSKNPVDWIDALIDVAGAFSDFSDAYDKTKKSKDE